MFAMFHSQVGQAVIAGQRDNVQPGNPGDQGVLDIDLMEYSNNINLLADQRDLIAGALKPSNRIV